MIAIHRRRVRRDADNCNRFDFYRTRLAALRGQAKRDAAALRSAGACALAMVAAFIVILAVTAGASRSLNRHAGIAATNSTSPATTTAAVPTPSNPQRGT
jgi:hypothetical protein